MPITYPQNQDIRVQALSPTDQQNGLITGLVHMLGRGLGGNKVTGGLLPNGTATPYVVAHPTIDALLNGGKANDYAQAMNAQVGSAVLAENQQLQTMKQAIQNEIAQGNNIAANQQKLAQIEGQIAANQTKLQQASGVATNAGVMAYNPQDLDQATPAAEQLAGPVGSQTVGNIQQKQQDVGQVLADPSYQVSLEKGMNAQNLAPEYANLASEKVEVPGVGGVGQTPNGPETITRQPDVSSSQSGVKMIDTGNGVQFPMQSSSSQSQGGGANVTIPYDQGIINSALQQSQTKSGTGQQQNQGGQVQQPQQPVTPQVKAMPQTVDPYQSSVNDYIQQAAIQAAQQQAAQQAAQQAGINRFKSLLLHNPSAINPGAMSNGAPVLANPQ